MSDTLARMRTDMNNYRKARNSESSLFLSTLIGEMMSRATLVDGQKVISEEAVQSVLKKNHKNLTDNIAQNWGNIEAQKAELALIETYQPKLMTREELTVSIRKSGKDNLRDIMTYLKENHAGLYDGKMASEIARSL